MKYGWVPDLPDQRDRVDALHAQHLTLPSHVDMRPQCPAVYDQGSLGSCTANAIAAAVQFERMRQNLSPDFVPSRLFIYYNERVMEGTVDSDAGAAIRDGIKSIGRLGVPPESEWPYDVSMFTLEPGATVYADAVKFKALDYWRVPRSLVQMRGCLAAGYPFVFGFTVYESFEDGTVAADGYVPMPQLGEKVLGGHAVLVVGYDDATQNFICRNSWGAEWGARGYFYLPYEFFTDPNLSDDFWTVKLEAA